MYQYLENLCTSVNAYFLNDQCKMFQNHVQEKHPFKSQDSSMDLNVTEYENFTDKLSDSHCN